MVWVLAGFMGCGKSSIGRLVARMAADPKPLLPPKSFPSSPENGSAGKAPDGHSFPQEYPAGRKSGEILPGQLAFIDLDEEIIRREGRSIPEIFADGGEAAFRAVERTTLSELLAEAGQLLISLGGGTLTDAESRALVREHCRCIYLRASLETLAANLRWEGEGASRPMLAGADPKAPATSPDSLEERISTLMALRAPIYESTADVIIDIDGLDSEHIARRILSLLA